MTDKRISIFVKNQLPGFVLEDHPKFVSFLEAYYEFLDTTSYGKAKDIRDIYDVDVSIDEFEQQFFNTFIPYIPRNTAINKEFIIKNIMPLYLSKGSEKSFKLLFRLLFDQESTLSYPGRSVLRASDAKWVYINTLRVTNSIYSKYISDGTTSLYYVPEMYDRGQFDVYIDGIKTIDYQYFKETQKVIFNTPPTLDSIIKVYYLDFNIEILNNRRIENDVTSAYALIENTGRRRVYGTRYFELLINEKTLYGKFTNGDVLKSDVLFGSNLIPLTLETFSDLEKINIVNGGSSYNIGDPVIIRGTATRDAVAIIDDIASGKIEDLSITEGGCGFSLGNKVSAEGYSNTFFNSSITTIDSQGVYSSNTITFNTDIIDYFSNVIINSADYGFANVGSENLNSVISSALTMNTISGLGGATSLSVLTSDISTTLSPVFDVIPDSIGNGLTVRDLGIIGKIKILNGGVGYNVNDNLVFTNYSYLGGQGVTAKVRGVDSNGSITVVNITDGGLSYKSGLFPTISVSSNTGTNAILVVHSIMGDGEVLVPILGNTVAGQILAIKILDGGISYNSVPGIDLSGYGDGLATATANIRNTYLSKGGKWKTSDGILSSEDIVLQGRDYYIDFSYVISSKVEFYRYKEVVRNLLHPVGLVNYSKYVIDNDIYLDEPVSIISTTNKALSGTINITNSSIVVSGTNTKFNVSVLSVGSNIAVNNQVRTVSSIQSNTHLEVSVAFTITSNNEIIKII
ncbi:hypothetical protein M0R04_04130 [Candidatus Dojkabacteria bacterium]|jgi:hypothetical protein|nr:hypothetical protein [Candidatus Dojkabacteria bacterium]